jgi:cystathionine gamma-synthase
MAKHDNHGFSTKAIHAGQTPDSVTGAVVPPIVLASTHMQDGVGNLRGGYEYARGGNPTRDALQVQLAALEGASHAFAFASGLAAEDALLRSLLAPGDTIVMGNDVYGGTHRLARRIFGRWDVSVVTVEMTDLEAVKNTVSEHKPKVLWVETPSNPFMKVSSIADLSEIAHTAGATVVVDNTFATPYLQRPLEWGADVVVHSMTKYLGGHSDVLGGAVVTSNAEIAEQVGFHQFAAGAVMSPFEAWLTTRGIKTLAVRVDRHQENAMAIAEMLASDSRVAEVFYPGLPSHPGHELAKKQMSGFSGMLSFRLASGAQAKKFVESTGVFTLAESLGGVESLVNYPCEMTHASVRGTELEVPDTIVRLSVGIESVEDLLADVEQALDKAL